MLAQMVVSRCRPAGFEMSTLYLRAFQLLIFFVSSGGGHLHLDLLRRRRGHLLQVARTAISL